MQNNIFISIALILLIGGGLGYAIFSAPELPEHLMFEEAMQTFADNSQDLETQFIANKKLLNISRELPLTGSTEKNQNYALKMSIDNNRVTLNFLHMDNLLTNQTVVLEPFMKDQKLRWKCLDGSVFIRFRSKECRLGQGLSTEELRSK